MTLDDSFKGLNPEQQREAIALSKRQLSLREKQFTSTGDKFAFHQDLVSDLNAKRPHIKSAHIMPTDLCNFACSFCSVADRNAPYLAAVKNKDTALNKKNIPLFADNKEVAVYERTPFLDFETEIKPAVSTLKKWGLKSVIFSGGGEPTFYKDSKGKNFTDLAHYVSSQDLEIAMITNGSNLSSLSKETRDLFEWVRVSWYPFEYPNIHNAEFDIPKFGDKTVLGYSLVVTNKPHKSVTEPLKGDDLFNFYIDKVKMINKHGQDRGAKYLRLVSDCHVIGDEHLLIHEVSKKLQDEVGGIVLYQQKFHRPPEKCYMGYVRPVIYANGLVFPCDSLVLNDQSDRRFHPSYKMTDIAGLDSFLQNSVGKMDSLISDPNSKCPKCVFFENNASLKQYVDGIKGFDEQVPTTNLLHKNFL